MELNTAANTLAALAHETRLAVFRHLMQAGVDGAVVGDVREALAIPNATLSFHLAALKRAGLLRCRREGRQLVYSVDHECMRALLQFLTEDCCGGRPEICAALAEAAAAWR